jgi:hypothetical protein
LLRGVPPPEVARKVLVGRHGRLFLDYDTNQIMAQHTGRLRFTSGELEAWRAQLEERIDWLASRGTHYLFVVAPDVAAVFPHDLPEHVRPVADRPLVQLMRHLEETGSPAEILYPLDALADESRHVTYPKTETHWSEWGAFLAYRAICEKLLEVVRMREITERQIVVHDNTLEGDLGSKLDPPVSSPHAFVEVRGVAQARFVADNRVENRGRRIEYSCEAAPDVCCLLLGDSYAAGFVPILAESFRRVVLAYVPTLDRALVEEVQPDVVIHEMAERFLISVPDDAAAITHADWEAAKRAQGRVLAPKRYFGNRVESLPPP